MHPHVSKRLFLCTALIAVPACGSQQENATSAQLALQPASSTQRPGYGFVRGSEFFGAKERFNRYYTDASYQPSRTIYVSPRGGGNGASADNPTTVNDGFTQLRAGQQLTFLASKTPYQGCWELDEDQSGTYDAPIVIYGERNSDGSRGVTIDCCNSGRKSCFNLETANHVAIDGFIMKGGR